MEHIAYILSIVTVIILWVRIAQLTKENMALMEQISWMSKTMKDPTSVQTLGVDASGGTVTNKAVSDLLAKARKRTAETLDAAEMDEARKAFDAISPDNKRPAKD